MKEADVRPAALFKKYLELSAADAITYFSGSRRAELPCPACGSKDTRPVFVKHGFGYVLCESCYTLYQSPRPSAADFARFYQESPSARYWACTFSPAVAEARRVHLIRPKVQELAQLCQQDQFSPQVFADIGAGAGFFLEEWRRSFPDTQVIAVEPNPDLADQCRQKNLAVLECFLEEAESLDDPADLVTAFEVIEHVHDPLTFCAALGKLLKPGGRVLLTGLTVDGFDLQVLWEKSNSISPPHHINFMSVKGFESLLARAGFTNLRIFTPGKLDVDIVRNAAAARAEVLAGQGFVQMLLRRGEKTLEAFQQFLSQHQLSSHCWVWASKSS
jgi:SAM-dependent methyltransferase